MTFLSFFVNLPTFLVFNWYFNIHIFTANIPKKYVKKSKYTTINASTLIGAIKAVEIENQIVYHVSQSLNIL
jgi:hypothetical protein